ncbi:MAG: dTMP kinase [Alphaproteobacteria bacterium]|nr:dTMP kinase [Alphaproteobacteria bacterium]MDD9920494.1 dTMP kinase [Alphaproteobacteria bacterium]
MTLVSNKPLFISVEGVDGSGKTTQLNLFCEWLMAENVDFIRTREPGGTEVGTAIRKLLLEGDGDKFDGLSELFLFSADRHEHLRQLILPALSNGQWVITDRFADSTTVFQSVARGLPREVVQQVSQLAVGQHWPDVTFILDISYEEGLARKQAQAEEGLQETRMESLGAEFHQKVRQGYQQIATETPERCHLIDARGSIDEVQQRLRDALTNYLTKAAAA